jgi:hypothetical protein
MLLEEDDDVVLFLFRRGGITLRFCVCLKNFKCVNFLHARLFFEDQRPIQSLEKQPTKLDASKKRKEFLEAYVIHLHVVDCSIFASMYSFCS